jgi:hypothetical protein
MVSYEVQPTNSQELSKRHQGAMKLSKGSKIHDITRVQWHVATLKETLPTIGYGNNTEEKIDFLNRVDSSSCFVGISHLCESITTRRFTSRRVKIDELRICPNRFHHQWLMCSPLYNLSIPHHCNRVCIPYCRQPVILQSTQRKPKTKQDRCTLLYAPKRPKL